jgi:hypothetical protein
LFEAKPESAVKKRMDRRSIPVKEQYVSKHSHQVILLLRTGMGEDIKRRFVRLRDSGPMYATIEAFCACGDAIYSDDGISDNEASIDGEVTMEPSEVA